MASLKSPEESPWEGSVKWGKVKDREEVGKVLDSGKNIGDVMCLSLFFESTGEVRFYAAKRVTRCDEDGNTEEPGEELPVKA